MRCPLAGGESHPRVVMERAISLLEPYHWRGNAGVTDGEFWCMLGGKHNGRVKLTQPAATRLSQRR